MILLALDSGVEKTGYAIFEKKSDLCKKINYIASGLIFTDKKLSLDKRLKKIYEEVCLLIKKYNPKIIVLEKIFFFKNQKTIINVSFSQGIVLLAAALNNKTVKFLTPLEIKQTITGYGRADKKAVLKMLSYFIKIDKKKAGDDEIDAIACGLAYCYKNQDVLK